MGSEQFWGLSWSDVLGRVQIQDISQRVSSFNYSGPRLRVAV